MKRIALFIVITTFSLIFLLLNKSQTPGKKSAVTAPQSTKTIPRKVIPIPSNMKGFLFVPYWSLETDSILALPDISKKQTLNTVLYFGITANDSGIDTQEAGFKNLSTFRNMSADINQDTLLTLRLTNERLNEKILTSTDLQNTIISQTLDVSNEYRFSGIVVDLEHSVLPTQETISSITAFLSNFASQTHAQNQLFAVTIYGDTLYRQRPYDLTAISEFSDFILIMSYDFHKSYGEPGPNFPLSQGKKYPYSLEKMLENFSKQVDQSKMVVLFGLYGYDWAVDDQNRPLTSAKAVTYNQVKARYIKSCPGSNCLVQRDSISGENFIQYTEKSGQKHVIWYEDLVSVSEKVKAVQSFGIDKVGYWAYGYY